MAEFIELFLSVTNIRTNPCKIEMLHGLFLLKGTNKYTECGINNEKMGSFHLRSFRIVHHKNSTLSKRVELIFKKKNWDIMIHYSV